MQELKNVETAYAISQILEEMSDFAISAVRWIQEREGVCYETALKDVLSGAPTDVTGRPRRRTSASFADTAASPASTGLGVQPVSDSSDHLGPGGSSFCNIAHAELFVALLLSLLGGTEAEALPGRRPLEVGPQCASDHL